MPGLTVATVMGRMVRGKLFRATLSGLATYQKITPLPGTSQVSLKNGQDEPMVVLRFIPFLQRCKEPIMSKSPFLKFVGLTSASLVLASLVACGGSSKDEPVKVTADLPVIALSADNVDLAKAVGAALKDKSISLAGSVDLPDGTKAENVPASTLAFTAVPSGAPANAIAGVSFKNEYYEATGFAMPGSMNIFFNQLIWLGAPNPIIWAPPVFPDIFLAPALPVFPSFLFPVFTVDFATSGLSVGPSNVNGQVNFGSGLTVGITTSVNVTSNNDGTSIGIGNTNLPVPTQPATGATGGTN